MLKLIMLSLTNYYKSFQATRFHQGATLKVSKVFPCHKSGTLQSHNFEKHSKEDVIEMTLENSNTLEAKVNAEVVDNPENARDSTNVIKSATPGYSKIGQSVSISAQRLQA